MASKGMITGTRGVFLAAAELARLGFIVSPTSRSAAGADILATTHDCSKAFSIQVKTKTTKDDFFLLGKKIVSSDSHYYVFVHIRSKDKDETIDFYIMQGKVVAANATPMRDFVGQHLIRLAEMQAHKSNWGLFGSPDAITTRKKTLSRNASSA